MIEKCFVDTNVWVYTNDARYPDQQRRATELVETLIREHRLTISTQVVSEFHEAVRRLSGVSAAQRIASTRMLLDMKPVPLTEDTLRSALDLHRRRQLNWWDSLILSSAIETGCGVLYTEDLQAGARIDGVRIENPFR